jgi:DNA-binding NarL/FixJ family response regulator
MTAEPLGLLLCDDLLWVSRFQGTAQTLGGAFLAVRRVDDLERLARERRPRCAVLDLGQPGATAADLPARLIAVCPGLRVAAYGSHVEAATLRAAREAGCDPVLPRSKLAEDLPRLLAEWLDLPLAGPPPGS